MRNGRHFSGGVLAIIIVASVFVALDAGKAAEKPTTAPASILPGENFCWVTAALDPPIGQARRIKLQGGPGAALAIIEQPGGVGSDGIDECGEGPPFNPRHSPIANAVLREVQPADGPRTRHFHLYDLDRKSDGPKLRLSIRDDGVARLLVLNDAGQVVRVVTLELPGRRE